MSRVLIVDDEAAIRRMLRVVLEQRGHTVSDAADGVEGLKLYDVSGADVVITDIVMPNKEGLEMLREIMIRNPDQAVIVISGGGQKISLDYLPIAERLGAVRTFAKPFNPAEIVDAVEEVLAAKASVA